ncbi:MAG: hypothetical protein P4N41_02460 [Negativicutes bacterium]|nr:hypothetical protein [Negativicutes bacterium]
MEVSRVKEVLTLLAEGVDPVTGEIFPPDSPYQNPEIIRALFTALSYLPTGQEKAGPENAGAAWTAEQEEELKTAFADGVPVKEIAAQSGRSRGAITSRLKKLGLLPY